MTNPSGIDATLSSFTPAQQEAIKALIAQAAAANAPAPPKELTPAEQVAAHIATARAALQHGGTTVTLFDRILSVLEIIAEKVFSAAVDAAASGVVGAVTWTTNNLTNAGTPIIVSGEPAPSGGTVPPPTTDTSSTTTGSAV